MTAVTTTVEGVPELSEHLAPPTPRPPPPPSGPPLGSWRLQQATELAALRASATDAVRLWSSTRAAGGTVGDGLGPVDPRLPLVISELATNALKYGGAATVSLYRTQDAWLIDVLDASPLDLPVLYPPDPGRAGQNGLLVVDSASATWGWYHDSGDPDVKHVWAAVADPRHPPE